MSDYRDTYRGRKVLVTGGLGFIGSNLARALADLGAEVMVVDSQLPDDGGKFAICHRAGQSGRTRTLSVGSADAVRDHLAHGDTLGACSE